MIQTNGPVIRPLSAPFKPIGMPPRYARSASSCEPKEQEMAQTNASTVMEHFEDDAPEPLRSPEWNA